MLSVAYDGGAGCVYECSYAATLNSAVQEILGPFHVDFVEYALVFDEGVYDR